MSYNKEIILENGIRKFVYYNETGEDEARTRAVLFFGPLGMLVCGLSSIGLLPRLTGDSKKRYEEIEKMCVQDDERILSEFLRNRKEGELELTVTNEVDRESDNHSLVVDGVRVNTTRTVMYLLPHDYDKSNDLPSQINDDNNLIDDNYDDSAFDEHNPNCSESNNSDLSTSSIDISKIIAEYSKKRKDGLSFGREFHLSRKDKDKFGGYS